MGFDDRFIRTWEYYLALSEAGLRHGHDPGPPGRAPEAARRAGPQRGLTPRRARGSPRPRCATMPGSDPHPERSPPPCPPRSSCAPTAAPRSCARRRSPSATPGPGEIRAPADRDRRQLPRRLRALGPLPDAAAARHPGHRGRRRGRGARARASTALAVGERVGTSRRSTARMPRPGCCPPRRRSALPAALDDVGAASFLLKALTAEMLLRRVHRVDRGR